MIDSSKRLFKKEYSFELLKIAKGDLESAVSLSTVKNVGRPENIVFLTQQSVEKALKATLNFLEIPFPLVHDLGILVALIPDEKMPPGQFHLNELTPYASVRRYEESISELTSDEVNAALDAASAVIKWAESYIKL